MALNCGVIPHGDALILYPHQLVKCIKDMVLYMLITRMMEQGKEKDPVRIPSSGIKRSLKLTAKIWIKLK